jgi:RND family efflux transporter MFP subunit
MTTVFDAKAWLPLRTARGRWGLGAVIMALAAASACGGGAPQGAPGGPPGGGMPAMSVELAAVTPKPIEKTSDYVGVVKSRHSATVQPQAEGFLVNILVKSGDHVSAGAVLMEIDAKSPEAALRSLESVKSARDIDVSYAQQELTRAKTLLDAGAGSQQDYDRAVNALKVAQAQVVTTDEQLRQQRTDLGYYKVTAPTAGIVGDIPVRTGDRVTRSTVLTTLDDNAGMEVYINVPVQQAPGLQLGLPVRLLDESGAAMATERVTFISPTVDDTTQSVLAKAALASGTHVRANQFVRAQVIWSTSPGFSVPVTAVLRINGQFFVFVAESERGGLVAHQRAVTLGPVSGNDYVLLGGLKAGEQLIVSGLQKIGDGAPVRAGGPGPAAPGGGRDGEPTGRGEGT